MKRREKEGTGEDLDKYRAKKVRTTAEKKIK